MYQANQNRTQADYTEETWAVFREAMDSAYAVLSDEDASAEEIADAAAALKNAVEQLAEKADDPADKPGTDKSQLQALYDAAVGKTEADYTVESWNAYQTALKAAEAVLNNEDATQEEIDAARAALDDAVRGLVKAEQETGGTGSGISGTGSGSAAQQGGSGADSVKAAKTGDTAPVAGLLLLLAGSCIAALISRRRIRTR